MYHHQQNKWYRQRYLLAHFEAEAILHSILAEANLLVHKNLWLCYYAQVKFTTAKIECSFEMGK